MSNIHDYLRWRGDLTFDERPFNDADNVVLSTAAYLDFAGIVPNDEKDTSISVRRACHLLLDKAGADVAPYVRSLARLDASFVELLGSSRRFGDLRLHGYVDMIDEERSLQFAALQIDLSDKLTYVAFRGTDNTIVGWREDFMLSFEVTEAQLEAATYLKDAITRQLSRGGQVMVGGHSKGGNLAEFATVRLSEELRDRVLRVYVNDGPGMAPEVMASNADELLGNRLKRIVPGYSVVGMLFAEESDPRTIVKSSGSGIGQHDPTTWQMTRAGLEELPELLPECVVLNDAIAEWAATLSLQERERATEEMFDALESGGAKTLSEIAATPESLQQVWSALEACDEGTREVAWTLVESVYSSTKTAATRAVREKMHQLRERHHNMAEEAKRLLLKMASDFKEKRSRAEAASLPAVTEIPQAIEPSIE